MRLRLTIRRHGLPETPIIWVVDTITKPTIAQFLEQVNEAVPIESGEWGFEDYAVEVKGSNGVNYECLHYQPVHTVMKEEDEVIIRPLLTQDLKIRKISGRHQISADGKHLVDGLAYGRPLLRRPADRPEISIAPRKKRRITYHEEDNEDDEGFAALMEKEAEDSDESGDGNNQQLVLHADFDDDDEDDDDDFAPGEDEEVAESAVSEEEPQDDDGYSEDEEKHEAPSVQPVDDNMETEELGELSLACELDGSTESKIRKLHSAFPKAPLAVCKYVLSGSKGDVGEAYEALTRGFRPSKPKSSVAGDMQEPMELSLPKTRSKSRKSSVKEPSLAEPDEDESAEEHNPLLDHYDRNGLPQGSIASGKALSFMAEASQHSPNRSQPVRSRKITFSPTEDTSNGLNSTPIDDHASQADTDMGSGEESSEVSSDEENASSSSDSSSDSSDSSDDNAVAIETSEISSSDSDSDSSSSDSSSDDELPEETSSKIQLDTPVPQPQPETVDAKTFAKPPPGKGKRATKERNKRRRQSNALNRLKEKGILPAGTTLSEFYHLGDINSETAPETAMAALEAVRVAKLSSGQGNIIGRALVKADEFELRRQQLLESLSSGGIEVGSEALKRISRSPRASSQEPVAAIDPSYMAQSQAENSRHAIQDSTAASEIDMLPPTGEIQSSTPVEGSQNATTSTGSERALEQAPAAASKQTTSSAEVVQNDRPRRMKLDINAGRRLLLGAIGVRAPKNKAYENKLRDNFMKDVRPLKAPTPVDAPVNIECDEAVDEDPEAWREKIIYRAVECGDENVVLSEPPFPFVQRWDPQQNGSWLQKGKRGGKRKKDQRDQAQYYQDDPRASKKQKQRNGNHSYAEEQAYLDASYEPSYQEDTLITDCEDPSHITPLESDDVDGEISQQLMNDLQAPSAHVSQEPDDLAPLPEDPSTLPVLIDGAAKVGMTIAFKQLVCSAETQWQPEMSSYRTAIVIAITESGELQLTYAMRDRKQNDKYYDEETGERIYNKFDMPESDDGMDMEDDGMLNAHFQELVDPKIVQEAPDGLGTDIAITEKSQKQDEPVIEETALPTRAEESADAQFSHVSETPPQSDVPQLPKDSAESVIVEASQDIQESLPSSIVNLPQRDYSAAEATNTTSDPSTPSLRGGDVRRTFETVIEDITDSTKRKISHLMKDAGFRSSVPSSVLKNVGSDGLKTPSDSAVFEKLMKDMVEIDNDNSAYSPKFNGFGSSPTRQPRESSRSPQELAEEESQILGNTQKTWETIEEFTSSPSNDQFLQNDKRDTSGLGTESEDERADLPLKSTIKRDSGSPVPLSGVPQGKAQAVWESFDPKNRRKAATSPAESSQSSPDLAPGLDGANETDIAIQYPKLSLGSSFVSQITDHGRQPDFNFDDSAVANNDIVPKELDAQLDMPLTLPLPGTNPEHSKINGDTTANFENRSLSGPEVDVPPPPMSVNSSRIKALLEAPSNVPDVSDRHTSSDDELFPTVDVILSQMSAQRESATPAPLRTFTKEDAEYKKAMAALDDEEAESSDRSTPRAFKKVSQRRSSNNVKAETRKTQHEASRSLAFEPNAPQPHATQSQYVIPKGSQVMDLTLSSDDEPEAEESDEVPDMEFKRWDADDPNDGDYIPLNVDAGKWEGDAHVDGGWVSKRTSTVKGVDSAKSPTSGLKSSSQASPNTRNRRKMERKS